MRPASSRSWDIALAVLGATALLIEGNARASSGLAAGAYLLALAAAAPIAWRRTAPLAALLTAEAGLIACVFAFRPSWTATAIVALLLFSATLHGDRLRSVLAGAFTAVGVIVITVLIDSAPNLADATLRVGLVFLSVAIADTVRTRRALRVAALEREARAEYEREQESERRVTNERLRIARELHDTLAHALVAMNVRAGVADHLGKSQDQSAALRDIKAVSATALRDLRTTLGLLREQGDAAPTGPVLDLAALPKLAEHAHAAGVHADVDAQLNGAAIPSAVGQAAYRIVQEALTNVLRHAHASNARVRVWTTPGALELEVVDDGRGATANDDAGHGLRGMAERAEALGGHVETGPLREGGWRVHAVLPVSGESTR
jgi:signal transduction histidine kinase